MRLLRDIGVLATCRPDGGQDAIHPVRDAALAWEGGTIRWAGPAADLPAELADAPAADAGGRLVVPGLVDAHTHLAFGGWRADEFERRIRGESYGEIAASGGGIAATVRATREASSDELEDRCRRFLGAMARLGVTTVEAKSGYGLSLEEEVRILEVYRRLGAPPAGRRADDGSGGTGPEPADARPLPAVVPTFLGAHAVPPGWGGSRGELVDRIAGSWIPAVAGRGLARFCDVFVEEEAFGREEARTVLEAGAARGLRPKLHADQLSEGGGAELAADVGAASADHLEHVSEGGARAMAEAGVVGVVLPLAGLYLGQAPAPARMLVDAGVPVAVATDFNPGTAPSYHLPLAMTLSCLRGGLTPAEALKGATAVAARAVGEEDRVGSLEEGKAADFAVLDAPDPTHWLYHHRPSACVATVVGGDVAWADPAAGVFPGGDGRPAGAPGAGARGAGPTATREDAP